MRLRSREDEGDELRDLHDDPARQRVQLTGPSVSGDDVIWWPVTVSATGQEGYVADELLIPAEAE